MQLLQLLSTGLLQLLVVGIPIFFLRQNRNPTDKKFILFFCLLFVFDGLVVRLLNVDLFAGQQWNWVGKTASAAWAIGFVYTSTLLSKADAGWTLKVKQGKSVFVLTALFLLLRLGLRIFFQRFAGGYRLETFCYEATLPGLSEEIVFRGILLGLLNKAFPATWTLLNASFGWGLVLTSVLFGLVHGLSFKEHWRPDFSSQRFLMTGGLGFVLGFIKEKAKSLAPAVLFHNLWNLIAYWGQ